MRLVLGIKHRGKFLLRKMTNVEGSVPVPRGGLSPPISKRGVSEWLSLSFFILVEWSFKTTTSFVWRRVACFRSFFGAFHVGFRKASGSCGAVGPCEHLEKSRVIQG